MTLLSRKTDYALLILSYLSKSSNLACAREIATHFNLNQPFVANILKELCSKGYVTSQRGVKGGYSLTAHATETTLAEFVDDLEDPVHLTECTSELADATCSLMDICPVRAPIAILHQRIREVLRSMTLADLFQPQSLVSPPSLGLLPVLSPPCATTLAK